MGLHNDQILRQTLPHMLTAPSHLHHDRRLYHDSIAADLRVLQEKKRNKAKGKAKATRLANQEKKKIEAGEALGTADGESEHGDEMDEGMSDIVLEPVKLLVFGMHTQSPKSFYRDVMNKKRNLILCCTWNIHGEVISARIFMFLYGIEREYLVVFF